MNDGSFELGFRYLGLALVKLGVWTLTASLEDLSNDLTSSWKKNFSLAAELILYKGALPL